jgi:DNA-binding transcriptional ArsR family regulator
MGATKSHIHTENQVALAQLFKALAHPARVAIVENLLMYDDLNCKDLGQLIQLAQSTISKRHPDH